MRVKDMSRQMREVRGQLESDEQLKSLMAGLRGSNIDESDFADKDVVMNLVEVDRDEQDQLPLVRACCMSLSPADPRPLRSRQMYGAQMLTAPRHAAIPQPALAWTAHRKSAAGCQSASGVSARRA